MINGKNVVSSGLVYGLRGYAAEADMYVGSANAYVNNYASTNNGKMPAGAVSSSAGVSSYAMTMRFGGQNANAYTAMYMVRVYAKLSDGSYVYTDVSTMSIYDIASRIYNAGSMSTEAGHNYLYNNILSVVNPNYEQREYGWSGIVD